MYDSNTQACITIYSLSNIARKSIVVRRLVGNYGYESKNDSDLIQYVDHTIPDGKSI